MKKVTLILILNFTLINISLAEGSAVKKVMKTSHYGKGDGFAGKKTASGEKFDPNKNTAAHKTLPLGTKLEVKNPNTGESVNVRVNDRGPFIKGRDLDLSSGAASKIDVKGVENLEVKVLSTPTIK